MAKDTVAIKVRTPFSALQGVVDMEKVAFDGFAFTFGLTKDEKWWRVFESRSGDVFCASSTRKDVLERAQRELHRLGAAGFEERMAPLWKRAAEEDAKKARRDTLATLSVEELIDNIEDLEEQIVGLKDDVEAEVKAREAADAQIDSEMASVMARMENTAYVLQDAGLLSPTPQARRNWLETGVLS